MDLMLFLQALLALAFVLGLMMVVFWLMRYCQTCHPFLKKMNVSARLNIVESKRINPHNVLVIARCDDNEYVLLVGDTQSLLLQTKKVDADAQKN